MASDMKERLIDAGLDLFYQQGFHAAGLDQIIAAVGTTKTTFYNHFESKEALALACIQKRDARWRKRFPALLRERAGDDPVNQLYEVFNLWQDWFSDIHFNGCLFIHACSEFPNPNDPCHVAARGNVLALRAIVAGLADQAGIEDPDRFAEQYSLLMQGSVVLEVIDRQNRAAPIAAEVADALIQRALPPRHAEAAV
ncbi:MAG: TetR/AcrR family transcriptional regulator [Phycisphaerales bacterium]|nr:MAG: TetR/AcrR family transcriptional regulator [Phycisphaerales bacterium]